MKFYTITNEYPGVRTGGIGTYIAGLESMLKGQLRVEAVDTFPRREMLLKHLYKATSAETEIWTHHLFPVGMAAFALSLFTKRTYCVFLHGNDFDTARAHPVRKVLAALVLGKARKVIVNSHALAKDVKDAYGISAIVLQPWLPQDAQAYLDSHVAVTASSKARVLTIGRFIPRKGFGLLLDAAKQLSDMQFIFAGPKNEYAQHLAARTNEEQVTNVEFVFDPSREESLALYRNADIFAMPTKKQEADREGFGIVYLEAQYAGLPVLASNYPEMKEAVSPLLHAYLCEPNSGAVVAQLRALQSDFDAIKMAPDLKQFVSSLHALEARKSILEDILYA